MPVFFHPLGGACFACNIWTSDPKRLLGGPTAGGDNDYSSHGCAWSRQGRRHVLWLALKTLIKSVYKPQELRTSPAVDSDAVCAQRCGVIKSGGKIGCFADGPIPPSGVLLSSCTERQLGLESSAGVSGRAVTGEDATFWRSRGQGFSSDWENSPKASASRFSARLQS